MRSLFLGRGRAAVPPSRNLILGIGSRLGAAAARPPRLAFALASVLLVALGGAVPARGQASFTAFESGPVRPLALSPDGKRLFAVNTPDGRLAIFRVGPAGIAKEASVPVGLEPVAVAARTNGEVWVVNHLSDSVSIVDVATTPPRVVRTLLVGDEPRDIVFAKASAGATARTRAFITAAHRGHQRPTAADGPLVDPQLTTPGVGRADVWVFDALDLGDGLEGTPVARLSLFGDTPRALAVSPDGASVYAAVFHSGNRTTALSEALVCDDGARDGVVGGPCTIAGSLMPGALPLPETDAFGQPRPEVGLIVKHDGTHWVDELGRNWDPAVRFTLPDRDVFALDATQTPPKVYFWWSGVGTILFNMAVNPVSGKVYVSNTDARNETRFEGPGLTPPGFATTSVQGHLHEARISVLSFGPAAPRHLNKHIDYGVRPAPPGTKEKSLATPLGMAVSATGARLYVAAFGSSKIGVFDVAELEADHFVPSAASQIGVSGGGPSGIVIDDARNRLYVATRFDNGISVIDLGSRTETAHVTLFDREPAAVKTGRPVLYDAHLSSSNGEASCASCHVFGDLDSLAWDLGNPHDPTLANRNPFRLGPGTGFVDFHGMKGPMTTQTLRGMANHGPMHWRGDRSGANDVAGDALDENAAFLRFAPAFEGLLGLDRPLEASTLQRFADFIMQVVPPPSPIRPIDGSLTTPQQAGRDLYFGRVSDTVFNCNGCHVLDASRGLFGTDGRSSFEAETQHFKIAHTRNAYQKVGMFGLPAGVVGGSTGFLGDQIRGSGYLHDGSIDTVAHFLSAGVFTLNETEEALLEAFIHVFDTVLAPAVGRQVTLTSTNAARATPRVALLGARAATAWPMADHASTPIAGTTECELVVHGNVLAGPDAGARGWAREANGSYRSDRNTIYTDAQLRALAATPGQELTYTCLPPGTSPGATARRAGIDRDEDGRLDGLDNCPAFPNAAQTDDDADTRGNGCDNCVAKANLDQLDLDADGTGDVCDNACGFGTTTLAIMGAVALPPGGLVELTATGRGPAAEIWFGGVPGVLQDTAGTLVAQLPASLTPGQSYRVELVNPEGCRSQEALFVTATGTPSLSCGLIGVEPFLLLGAFALARRSHRATSSTLATGTS